MVLFRISAHSQLINSLFLIDTIDEEADLMLLDFSDFEGIVDRIRELGIFRKVKIVKGKNIADEWHARNHDLNSMLNSGLMEDIDEDTVYSACYFGHDMLPNKLYYYHLLKRQKAPDIYLMEDGVDTYSHDVVSHAMGDGISHNKFGKNSFLNRIRAQYVFSPEIMARTPAFPVVKFPEFTDRTKDLLIKIYGTHDIPDEPFIFLAQCFYEIGTTVNETALFDMFANEVGKENIIIKQHPRSTYDVYSGRGVKIMQDISIPWEAYVLNPNMKNKILVSVSSAALFSPFNMFGIKQGIFSLHNMYCGNFSMLKNGSYYQHYISKVYKKFNKEEMQFFAPKTIEELREQLIYAKGRWINR